jgi:hypothetical protein
MVGPDMFKLRRGRTDEGSFVRLSTERLKDVPKEVDVLEIRASSITMRHRWELDGENYDKTEAGISFVCTGVKTPNSF